MGKIRFSQVLNNVNEAKKLGYFIRETFKKASLELKKAGFGIYSPSFQLGYYFVITINVLFLGPLLIHVNFIKCLDFAGKIINFRN